MFTFNGVHANTHGLKVVTVDRSPLPAIENTLLEVPSINGAYFIKNRLKPRTIDITVKVIGTSEADLRTKVRNIGAWLYSKQPQVLQFDDENSKQYNAVVDTASVAETLKVGEGTIKFICPTPFAEGNVLNTVNLTANGTKELWVEGSADTLPVFTFTFTGVADYLYYEFSDAWGNVKGVTIGGSFKAGDVIKADHAKGYITLNGTNAMPMLSLNSDLFNLPSGASWLWVEPAVLTAKVEYKDRWL